MALHACQTASLLMLVQYLGALALCSEGKRRWLWHIVVEPSKEGSQRIGPCHLGNNHAVLQFGAGCHSLSQLLVLWCQMLAVATPAQQTSFRCTLSLYDSSIAYRQHSIFQHVEAYGRR